MELTEILKRIEDLEKQVRRQRLILAGICLMTVSVVVMAATPQSKDATFDTVTAHALLIKNHANYTVGSISYTTKGGILVIDNALGEPVAALMVNKDGGLLSIRGESRPAVMLFTDKNGGGLELSNNNGKDVVKAMVDENGSGTFSVFDHNGKGRRLAPN